MKCVLVFLAAMLLKLPSSKKAQEFLKEVESKFLILANRYILAFYLLNHVFLRSW